MASLALTHTNTYTRMIVTTVRSYNANHFQVRT